MIVDENVFAPATVSSPVFITAPAADTLVASVTSAAVSIPNNLVRSASVMIAPEPAFDTSDNAVTLDVVYTPFVTVVAFPEISPMIVLANVTAPPELIVIAFDVVAEPIVLPSVILMLPNVAAPVIEAVPVAEILPFTDKSSVVTIL